MANKKNFGVKPSRVPKTGKPVKPAKALAKLPVPKKPKVKKPPVWMAPPSVKNNPMAENSGPIPMGNALAGSMMPKKTKR